MLYCIIIIYVYYWAFSKFEFSSLLWFVFLLFIFGCWCACFRRILPLECVLLDLNLYFVNICQLSACVCVYVGYGSKAKIKLRGTNRNGVWWQEAHCTKCEGTDVPRNKRLSSECHRLPSYPCKCMCVCVCAGANSPMPWHAFRRMIHIKVNYYIRIDKADRCVDNILVEAAPLWPEFSEWNAHRTHHHNIYI